MSIYDTLGGLVAEAAAEVLSPVVKEALAEGMNSKRWVDATTADLEQMLRSGLDYLVEAETEVQFRTRIGEFCADVVMFVGTWLAEHNED